MGLGHAPAACARHGAIARDVNGAVLRTDEAVRERWERMVAARLDDRDGGWLSGVLLGVSALVLCAMLGHLQVNIEYLKFEVVLIDWGALSGVDAGDEGGRWGNGASAQKKGVDAGTSLRMGEIPLTIDKAALLATLLLVESQLLPFDAGECVFMGEEMGDVCDDARIFEVDKCVVDDEMGEVVGVEDAEVSISGGHRGEGGFGKCTGVEGFEVLNLILAVGAEVVSILTNLQVVYVLGYLWSLFFVRENEGVVVTTAGVVLHPPLTWVVGVLVLLVTVIGDSDVGGG